MKILIIGGTGDVGQAAVDALSGRHEVIAVGRRTTPAVDVADPKSIERLLRDVGAVDAVVCAFGSVPYKSVANLAREDYEAGFAGKVLSQLDVVRLSLPHLSDGGSITLTSGILAREPIATGAVASMANGALEAFAMAAAPELPRGIRINVVSPTVLERSTAYHDAFPGFAPAASAVVGRAFVKAVEGISTGRVLAVD